MPPNGPQNGLPPSAPNFGTDMPQTAIPEPDITAERNMQKFSKVAEFQKLRQAMESRIEYWKVYAPGSNDPVRYRDLQNEERGWRSLVADVLIEEFQSVLNAYEMAGEVVTERDSKKSNKEK